MHWHRACCGVLDNHLGAACSAISGHDGPLALWLAACEHPLPFPDNASPQRQSHIGALGYLQKYRGMKLWSSEVSTLTRSLITPLNLLCRVPPHISVPSRWGALLHCLPSAPRTMQHWYMPIRNVQRHDCFIKELIKTMTTHECSGAIPRPGPEDDECMAGDRSHGCSRLLLVQGTIPAEWADNGAFPVLSGLALDFNLELSGSLPATWGRNASSMAKLQHLRVG